MMFCIEIQLHVLALTTRTHEACSLQPCMSPLCVKYVKTCQLYDETEDMFMSRQLVQNVCTLLLVKTTGMKLSSTASWS